MNLDITLEEVLQELDLLRAANEEVDRKLEALMEERDRLGKQLLPNGAESEQRILQAAELAKVDCRLVIDKLSRADNIAQSISGKVRRLDDAQRRLQEAMELVDEMLDLKLTIENVKEAIEEENFESAAKGTHRILSHWRKKRDLTGHSYMYDKELAEDEEAFVEEVSYETLEKLENELRVKVKFQCEKGIERIHSKSGDDGDAKLFENTINLCKLYPLLGMHREGLDSYVGLIRWKLKQKLLQQGLLLSAQPIGAVIDHLRIIPETLDCITMAIQEQNEQFQAVFGSGFQILLLKDSIRLVNEILTDVVKDFIDSKSIPKKAKLSKKIISGSRVHGPTGASQRNLERKTVESMAKKTEVDELCDPRSLDTYLEEISFICREIYLWDLEIRKAGRLALSTLKSSEDNRQALLDESEKDFSQPTPLNEICQDLIGQYITLEELYLTLNIRKALEMDEGDTDSMVSTVVDDVFFVIRKCAARSFSMLNMDSSCAVINRIAEALSKEFFTAQNYYLDEYIQAIQDASSGSSFASKLFVGSGISGVINDPLNLYKNRGISFYFLLNNLEKSSLNLSVLKDQLEVEFQRIRDQIDPEPTKLKKSTELMKNCLNELFQVAASFENLSDVRSPNRLELYRIS